jgi:Domain of unknown function (DUF4157)
MSAAALTRAPAKDTPTRALSHPTPVRAPTIQRACACGGSAGVSGKCSSCESDERLGKSLLQPKLTISTPDDPYEREAERIADEVMRMPASGAYLPAIGLHIQREEASEEDEDESLQLKAGGDRSPQLTGGFAAALVRQHGGTSLPAPARAFFEPRFGRELSGVRIHDHASAARFARTIGARAFTHGRDIYFAPGQYDTLSNSGRRLLAHELTHVFQQEGLVERDVLRRMPAASEPQETHGSGQPPTPGPPAPSNVQFNIPQAIPVPPQGTRPLRATANVQGVTWSLNGGTAAVAPGTTIAPNGTITLGAAQTAGTIEVRATNSAGAFASGLLRLGGTPTGITGTSLIQDAPAGNYGHVFDHTFTSSTGSVADLENLAVGERFPSVPNPTGSTHAIAAPTFPFGGTFTLHTATLTPDASNNWHLTSAGQLGGSHDSVTIGQAAINVGRFVRSASNPTPAATLPVGFALDQRLHWYNPLDATPANRWTGFVTVVHNRSLVSSGTAVNFETTVNGLSDGGDTYVGPPAVFGLAPSPANVPPSPSGSQSTPPPPRTMAINVNTLPSPLGTGQTLNWTIQGSAPGFTLASNPANPAQATLTIPPRTVTVRATAAGSGNFDESAVQIP